MIHPHDTDRILAVLGDAIEKLRIADAPYWKAGKVYSVAHEVANDLALLHGAVSAEAERADENRKRSRNFGYSGAVINFSKRERIEQDVLNGEMREDD